MVSPSFKADGLFQKLMRGERCRRVTHMYMYNIRTVGARAGIPRLPLMCHGAG